MIRGVHNLAFLSATLEPPAVAVRRPDQDSTPKACLEQCSPACHLRLPTQVCWWGCRSRTLPPTVLQLRQFNMRPARAQVGTLFKCMPCSRKLEGPNVSRRRRPECTLVAAHGAGSDPMQPLAQAPRVLLSVELPVSLRLAAIHSCDSGDWLCLPPTGVRVPDCTLSALQACCYERCKDYHFRLALF